MSKEELEVLISQTNEDERKYTTFIFQKLQTAEAKFSQILEVYKDIENELQANQNALNIWLTFLSNKYTAKPSEEAEQCSIT